MSLLYKFFSTFLFVPFHYTFLFRFLKISHPSHVSMSLMTQRLRCILPPAGHSYNDIHVFVACVSICTLVATIKREEQWQLLLLIFHVV